MAGVATTKLSSKGQVVIPESIRRKLHLKTGAQFVVVRALTYKTAYFKERLIGLFRLKTEKKKGIMNRILIKTVKFLLEN